MTPPNLIEQTLQTIAENEKKVYDAGYNKGRTGEYKEVEFGDGETITVEDNTVYTATTEISSLTIIYPEKNFICHFDFTLSAEGDVTIVLPESRYIGGEPTFENDETWEMNIKNGVVVGGKVT